MYVECVIISDKRTARQKREVTYSLLFTEICFDVKPQQTTHYNNVYDC